MQSRAKGCVKKLMITILTTSDPLVTSLQDRGISRGKSVHLGFGSPIEAEDHQLLHTVDTLIRIVPQSKSAETITPTGRILSFVIMSGRKAFFKFSFQVLKDREMLIERLVLEEYYNTMR